MSEDSDDAARRTKGRGGHCIDNQGRLRELIKGLQPTTTGIQLTRCAARYGGFDVEEDAAEWTQPRCKNT